MTGLKRAIVTDIEGTTSAISFVKDVLFPFAAQHLPSFVAEHASSAEVSAVLKSARDHLGNPNLPTDELVKTFLQWIAEDKKVTALKTLQGMIWKSGYERGELKGHLYPEVAQVLATWKAGGHALYVFSSGSIAAQRLLFAHTEYGDLTPLFSGYFDTTTGSKLNASSYTSIAQAVGRPPDEVVFLSDHEGEIAAAQEAGMRVVCLVREGQNTHQNSPYLRATSFREFDPQAI
ncbi:MAG: acireductone synthase [Polyangiaceae bacterium]|nr:acireductone synthase [Polyangiaceae bacterium]